MLNATGKSQTGTKILLEAMSEDKIHLARFVLDALDGEIVDSRTEGAQTPLISSILLPDGQARCKFAELLLQKGAKVNCQNGSGRTALSYACERGHLDAVKILVRHNADPEVEDCWGNTALMYAAAEGHSGVVEFLVRAFKRLGLQIDKQNKAGKSAVEVAKLLGHTGCFSALTHNAKRGCAPESAPPGNELEREVEHLTDKLELSQICTKQTRHRVKQNQLLSMDSIEEFDAKMDASFGLNRPPPLRDYSPSPKPQKTLERLKATSNHLLPLIPTREVQKSYFLPPGNTSTPSASSALSALLTPIVVNRRDYELERENIKMQDLSGSTFEDSYYKKRCSLPTSIFSPTPPERSIVPVRKTRTVRRRATSPNYADPLQCNASGATTFSALSNKLLCRFTASEIKKDANDLEKDPIEMISRQIPRSETFPQTMKHPQVDSKASIDSISSVKCEFDFHFPKNKLSEATEDRA